MTLRALVADDEPLARARLVRLLKDHPDVTVLAEATDGEDVLAKVAEYQPDLLFLDIDMPRLDGLGVAEKTERVAIIYVTAHANYAADAFEADAYDFLLKPVSRERLDRAIQKVIGRGLKGTDRPPPWALSITDGSATERLDVRRVTRFFAADKYTCIRMGEREVLVRESLDELEQRFSAFGFVRVHRGELLRLEAVEKIDAGEEGALAILNDGQQARISRRALPTIRKRFTGDGG